MARMNLSTTETDSQAWRTGMRLPKGKGGRGGMD